MTTSLLLAAVLVVLLLGSHTEKVSATTNAAAAAVVGFGSCNRHDAHQQYWTHIARELRAFQPTTSRADAFFWTGDVVYADTRLAPAVWVESPLESVRAKYLAQRSDDFYSAFVRNDVAAVNGVWDDHDMGKNDGGKEFSGKDDIQKIFLDFLDVPSDSPRRQQRGVYTAEKVPMAPEHPLASYFRFSLCALLLDVRYFRDDWDSADEVNGGDMLGPAQWRWLQEELKHASTECAVTVIGSGVQILMDVMPTEQWSTFPRSRDRLFSMIRCAKADRVIFISGDVHFGELSMDSSAAAVAAMGYPIIEATSSGLTHTAGDITFLKLLFGRMFPSRRRRSVMLEKNFGSIVVSGSTLADAKVSIRVHSLERQDHQIELTVPLATLTMTSAPTTTAELDCPVVKFPAESAPPVKRLLIGLHEVLPKFIKMYHLIFLSVAALVLAVAVASAYLIWRVSRSLIKAGGLGRTEATKPKQG